MLSPHLLERRLQISGFLIILGLVVEAFCLFWSAPIAFVLFLCAGGVFIGLGILTFLYSLVSPAMPTENKSLGPKGH